MKPILLNRIYAAIALFFVGIFASGTVCFASNSKEDVSLIRPLSAAMVSKNGINYSPFRTAHRESETIPDSSIRQDLVLIKKAGFGFVRVFDSSDERTKKILEIIKKEKFDIKVMLGIYIQGNKKSFNEQEVMRGIKLANSYPETVVAVSVGNETLIHGSPNPVQIDEIIEYVHMVRAAVSQPVTTSDVWLYFTGAPKKLLRVLDFVSMHSYPILGFRHWDWKQLSVKKENRADAMMNAAIVQLQYQYSKVRENLVSKGQLKTPIIIGETGWKAFATDDEHHRAHPVNQKMYFERLMSWQSRARGSGILEGPASIIWFQAFDEPWKKKDDGWGLFNVDRKARFALHALFDRSEQDGTKFTDKDALSYSP